MMGGWDRWGVVDLYQGVGGGGHGVGIISQLFFFLFVLLSFILSCLVSFLSE